MTVIAENPTVDNALRGDIAAWGRLRWGSEFDKRLPYVTSDLPMFVPTSKATFRILYDRGVAAEVTWKEIQAARESEEGYFALLDTLRAQIGKALRVERAQ